MKEDWMSSDRGSGFGVMVRGRDRGGELDATLYRLIS
jgi:hypothetical protein